MLRGVTVAPQDNAVAYSALGHIYVRRLPDGRPARLTQDDRHFEFMPSWSRDGQSIVYVAWDDETLGSIRVVPAAGGDGRAVTLKPGHYVDPVFSPDGSKIVYGKVSGGFLSANTYATEPGVYWVPVAGGEGTRITRKGTNPQFGAGSDRVFLVTSDPDKENNNTKLFSIGLDGTEERVHLSSANATEFMVSPDGTWVAWAERFNVYLTPFVLTGHIIELGPKVSSVPIYKATSEAGANLSWSGDSKDLHWSLGPELFTLNVDQVLARAAAKAEEKRLDQISKKEKEKARGGGDNKGVAAGQAKPDAPEKPDEPKPVGLNISFTQAADIPSAGIALVGGRVITMRGDEVLEPATILVKQNRITAVGSAPAVTVPEGTYVIDCAGRTILPGFIDVHAHGPQGADRITPQQNWGRYADLAFGVTSDPRPLERHGEHLLRQRNAARGPHCPAAHLLHWHYPLRRGRHLQGPDR